MLLPTQLASQPSQQAHQQRESGLTSGLPDPVPSRTGVAELTHRDHEDCHFSLEAIPERLSKGPWAFIHPHTRTQAAPLGLELSIDPYLSITQRFSIRYFCNCTNKLPISFCLKAWFKSARRLPMCMPVAASKSVPMPPMNAKQFVCAPLIALCSAAADFCLLACLLSQKEKLLRALSFFNLQRFDSQQARWPPILLAVAG